ncbi:MAG: DUF819 domain-containing protein [Spirosomataceae bacterium]
MANSTPFITNDAVLLGILIGIIWLVFVAANSSNPLLIKIFKVVPPILLCYFIPSVLNSLQVIDGHNSKLYPIVSNYFLPACLILFTLSVDFKSIAKLGQKAILVFLAGTVGVILGGPLALWIVKLFQPELFVPTANPGDEVWRGLATIAGSWIGGGANQTALKEIFKPSDYLFSQTVAVDIVVAEIILAVLLYAVGHTKKIDKFLKADTSSLEDIQQRVSQLQSANKRVATFYDIVTMLGVAFVATGIAHFFAGYITPFIQKNHPELAAFSLTSSFFWVISIVTLLGILASFTSLRHLENVGASQYGSFFLYLLITTIGMQMDLTAIVNNPVLFVIGVLWMTFHVILVVLASIWLKAPFFFGAVGSQANIGGAASAPVVAAAFHPSLVSVGVLLAVLGYAVGTYGGYICALLMQWVATG